MSGYVPEAAFARPREAFAQAVEWLAGPGAAGLDHAAVEEGLAARGREIQRLLFQGYLDMRAAAERRLAQVMGPDGICRTWAERGHGRPLSSVFGPVRVSRIAYRAPGAGRMSPAARGTGVISKTAPASAIRLRVRTSPRDSRPSCFGTARAAWAAARGRSEPGRILMPLPSASRTTTAPAGAAAGPGRA